MNQSEIDEVLRLHKLWLEGHKDGKRANLSGADLLRADLSGANLSEANLFLADLIGANLIGANLREADLREANLSRANLIRANLSGAKLWDTIGNGVEIRTLQLPEYTIVYAGDRIQIGCKNHSIQEWSEFDDEVIKGMSDNALDFWNKYKVRILSFSNLE